MQASTLKILEKRFPPEDARVLAEAIEEEIRASKLVTEDTLKFHLADTKADLVRWVFLAIIGQTTLLTGIMYFLLRTGK